MRAQNRLVPSVFFKLLRSACPHLLVVGPGSVNVHRLIRASKSSGAEDPVDRRRGKRGKRLLKVFKQRAAPRPTAQIVTLVSSSTSVTRRL